MKLRVALVTASVVVGAVAGVAAPAQASTPTIGNNCASSEAGALRYTQSGKPTVCAYMGGTGRYRWVATAKVDPVTRTKGQPCAGTYPVARTAQGKAIRCSGGRWR